MYSYPDGISPFFPSSAHPVGLHAKRLLIMKMTIILLIAFSALLYTKTYAQKITIAAKDISL